jgi:hypothetical protein
MRPSQVIDKLVEHSVELVFLECSLCSTEIKEYMGDAYDLAKRAQEDGWTIRRGEPVCAACSPPKKQP